MMRPNCCETVKLLSVRHCSFVAPPHLARGPVDILSPKGVRGFPLNCTTIVHKPRVADVDSHASAELPAPKRHTCRASHVRCRPWKTRQTSCGDLRPV